MHVCYVLSLRCLQNFAAQATLPKCCWHSAIVLLREHGLSTLSSRRDFHLAQHSFKTICGLHPPYLKSLLIPTSAIQGHQTRQASTGNVHLPLPKTNFGKKTFSYNGATMWTSLSTNTQNVSTISAFNSIVNPFLFNTKYPICTTSLSPCYIIFTIYCIFQELFPLFTSIRHHARDVCLEMCPIKLASLILMYYCT